MQTDVYIKIINEVNEYKILDGWILVIPAIIAFAFRTLFISGLKSRVLKSSFFTLK